MSVIELGEEQKLRQNYTLCIIPTGKQQLKIALTEAHITKYVPFSAQ